MTSLDATEIEAKIRDFLNREIPQIKMHGGESYIEVVDADAGEVRIRLTAACHGCGLAPMTEQAIKRKLIEQVDGVTEVHTSTEPASRVATGADTEF